MDPLRLRISIDARRSGTDDAEHVVELVRRATERGAAAPAAVVVRAERIELVELVPVVRAGIPVPAFLAGLTRSKGERDAEALAVGLAGRFLLRRRSDPQRSGVPVALVFLEWPDNAWWHWRALLDADATIREDTITLTRAVDGDPLPESLGRWWSLGRRMGYQVQYGPLRRPEPLRVSEIVH